MVNNFGLNSNSKISLLGLYITIFSRRYSIIIMHLSILIPGGKGAGNGWGFDKKIKNWVKYSNARWWGILR